MVDDALQRLIAMEEIKTLKARYFRFLDSKDWPAWGDLFTEDVQFEHDTELVDSSASSHNARADLLAWISEALKGAETVHHGYTPEITIVDSDTASGIWAFSDRVVFAGNGTPTGFSGDGHYHEEYVRTDRGWRIKRVSITRQRLDVLEGGLPDIATTTGPYPGDQPTD